jgi:hypothetical protein
MVFWGFTAFIIDLLAKHPEAKELTMLTKLTNAEAKAHIPRLVLNQHVHKQIHGDSLVGRINTRMALGITRLVGSMWCAYLFALLALISLPAAISSHDPIIIVAWIAQTFLQLVLLPIIIVGQNVQAAVSDARAESDHETLLAIHTLTVQVHEIANQQTAILKILEERSNR